MRAVTETQGPAPARVAGTVVCTGVTGIAVAGGGKVTAGVVLVMFIDGAGRGVDTCSSGLRV
jgi:hypothetical protein